MSTYRVFLGAPTADDLRDTHGQNEESTYQWQTVSSKQFIARAMTADPVNTHSHDGIRRNISGGSLQPQSTSASLAYSQPRHVGSLKFGGTQSVVFPLATLEAASRRISLIYKNIIFDESADDEEYDDVGKEGKDQTGMTRGMSALPSLLAH
jgi:hypothetical protein